MLLCGRSPTFPCRRTWRERPCCPATGRPCTTATKAGVRAWNLETGIRRVIKEAGFAQQSVTGLHLNDTVLQCRVADNEGNASTLLLSTESGRILYEGAQELTMRSRGDSYFISFPTGCTRALLFGRRGRKPLWR